MATRIGKKEDDIYADQQEAPEGYDTVVTAGASDGWWTTEVGRVLTGRLLGRFYMAKDDRYFYQLKTSAPSHVSQGSGSERKFVVVPAGSLVNFDEKKDLENLKVYTESDNVYDIWIRALEKKELKNNKSFWRFDTRLRRILPHQHPTP